MTPDPSGVDPSVDGLVYVLVPVHNRRALTEQFVSHLVAQTDPGWTLVLLDDGSTDGTAEMVHEQVAGATILRGPGDWWWGGALQQGYRWLAAAQPSGDALVLIINDDTSFDPGLIAAAREALRGRPRSLLLARLHDWTSGDLVEVGARVDWRNLSTAGVMDPSLVNCFSTRGLFLRAADFLAIGGFHPRVLPHYLSDYEFTMRAHAKGFRLISDPSVQVRFDGSKPRSDWLRTSSLRGFLRMAFSKRTSMNPFHWTAFVLLRSPRRYVPSNIVRVWYRFFAKLARHGR